MPKPKKWPVAILHESIRASICAVAALLLAGCAATLEEDMIGVPTTAVGHYGRYIGIPDYLVNGRRIGNNTGWGGGGGFGGSTLLPRHPKGPVMITVKWESCDASHIEFINDMAVDPNARCVGEWHEATIPVNFAVEPGNGGSGMYLHFLPGHQVEAWVTSGYPEGSAYPGPAYPDGPAPENPPMPGKNPIPPATTKNAKP